MCLSDRVAQIYPQASCTPFVAFSAIQGYGGVIITLLHTEYEGIVWRLKREILENVRTPSRALNF
jgi:hypothetical protein